MSKIVLFGVGGTLGTRIAAEAAARGHDVTPIRSTQVDVTDAAAVAEAVRGQDAVISAVGPSAEGGDPAMLVRAAHALLAGVTTAGVPRLLVVGGAGTLRDSDGVRLVDGPGFPEAWKPVALAHGEALDVYRANRTVDWSYLSPAALIEPGERTGTFRLGEEDVLYDADGQSHVSAEDYAVALIDELEAPKHIRSRFTVGY